MSHFFFYNFLLNFRASELHLVSSVGGSTRGWQCPQCMTISQAHRAAWGSGARSTSITEQLWASPPQNQVTSSQQTGRGTFPTTVKRSASETPEALWESCFLSGPHWGIDWGPLCNLKKTAPFCRRPLSGTTVPGSLRGWPLPRSLLVLGPGLCHS